MRFGRRAFRYAVVVAAIFLGATGVAFATQTLTVTSTATTAINACELNTLRTIRIVADASACNAKYETPISWNVVGPKGDQGPAGTAGVVGTKGDTGATGLQGQTGLQGVKGDTGVQGPQGETGVTGAQGSKGDKGDPGLDSNQARVVTATDTHGFVLAPKGDKGTGAAAPPDNGTIAFTPASDAPLGSSVLDIKTSTGGPVVVWLPQAQPKAPGRLLSELTSFSYASKVATRSTNDTAGAFDVTAQIEVVGANVAGSGYTTVVYEPYQNGYQGAAGWHRNDVVHGKVWSTRAPTSGNCTQAAPCPFSQFIAENPKATVITHSPADGSTDGGNGIKFRVGQNNGGTDLGSEYQVDDVLYGFGSALQYDFGG